MLATVKIVVVAPMPMASDRLAVSAKTGVRPSRRAGLAQVPPPVVEPPERAGVAVEFLRLLDAAERAPGRDPRLVGRQAATLEVLFQQREVRRDLTRQFRLALSRAQDVAQPAQASFQE